MQILTTIGVYCLSALILMSHQILCVELTFDLPDSARECFHEHIINNQSVVVEYQVNYNQTKIKKKIDFTHHLS